MTPSDLQLRAGTAPLPAAATAGTSGAVTDVLKAVPCSENGTKGATWRVIELYSNEGLPWEAHIEWAGGQGGIRSVDVTVARTTRLCVYASTVTVTGAARAASAVNAWATIADGVVATENELSISGALGAQSSATITVPRFAKFIRLELDTETEYPLSSIALIDGWGTTRNVTRGDRQPSPGLPVGDSKQVTVSVTDAVNYRVTFILSL